MTTPSRAFVTLLTSDSYLPGALTTINSVLDVEGAHPTRPFKTVCLVTPSTVGQDSLRALQRTFDQVIGVEEITTESWKELDLLGRQDLAASLTKLHIFRLTQFTKIIFLDADTLVLRPLSPLFDLVQPLSAAPDSGWPDAFNSGVMVCSPSEATFAGLSEMLATRGSWDGGDQGLLNDFFPDWNRLSYTYNVTPSAYYTYAPAYQRHGDTVSVLHFIGRDKPWSRGSRAAHVPDAAVSDYYGLVGKWFDVYERHFGSGPTSSVASRVVNPPASFKSTYADLPSRNQNRSVPIAIATARSASPNVVHWDPSRSSPPRNSKDLQMREPITTHYDNIWDDPSKAKQGTRFEAPARYPAPPPATHEWYKGVMRAAPDPTAVKAVFPWEERREASKAAPAPSRTFPADEAPRSVPASVGGAASFAAPPSYSSAFAESPIFTNAWDDIPGINRYAKNLARATAPRKNRERSASNSAASPGANGAGGNAREELKAPVEDGMGGRTSSLKEHRPFQRRGDASSRDGDDEDEAETTGSTGEEDSEADRPPIVFKQGAYSPRSRSGSASSSKSVSRSASGGRESGSGSGSSTAHGSPTKMQGHLKPAPAGGPQSAPSPQFQHSAHDRPHSHGHHPHAHHPHAPPSHPAESHPPSLGRQTAADLPTNSPRLAAQANRNSVAARLTAHGGGTGNGSHGARATRVFSPETDPGVVKKEGLAALQRFVQHMEDSAAAGDAAAGGANGKQGGAGSAGAYRF